MELTVPTHARLRPELEIVRTGPRSFLLVNRHTGTQLTCGAEERFLLHLLERSAAPDAMLRAYARRFGRELPPQRLLEFLEQLRQLELLADEHEAPPPAVLVPPPTVPAEPAPPVPVPYSAADPHATLNRVFDVLVAIFGWLAHLFVLVPLLLLVALGITAFVQRWGQFSAALSNPSLWVSPVVLVVLLPLQTLLFVSLPHAVLRGILGRRFGARLRGFKLHFFEGIIPTFACDFGDSFAVLSDSGRKTLLASGIWYFLAVASFATLAWAMCRPGSFGAAFWVWMIPPCLVGLFCQCNPFFKQGVYLLICNAREDPHWGDRAVAETLAWLNGETSPEALTAGERYWFRLYGVAYYVFRLLFDPLIVLLIGSSVIRRFGGPGALVFGVLVLCWYRAPLGRLLMLTFPWLKLFRAGGPWWVRWSVRLALAAGVIAVGFIPYGYDVVGECRLVPLAQQGVRSQLTDEIVEMHVGEGDTVAPGDPIATLSSRSVTEQYLTTQAELDKAQANLDLLKAGYRAEDIKITEERVHLYQLRVAYYDEQMRREERLLNSQVAARQEYERYKRDHDTAKDQLLIALETRAKLKSGYREEEIRAAAAALRVQQEKLKYFAEQLKLTKIVTPVGGRVITPYLEQKRGQQARAGELVAVIQDASRLRVEVAAEDAAAEFVRPGMRVNVRLYGLHGELLTGRVLRLAQAAEQDRTIGISTVRSDPEIYQEKMTNSRSHAGTSTHVRVLVELDDYPPGLRPDMMGYARIVVDNSPLWRSLVRPVARFLRTEVWSWLP